MKDEKFRADLEEWLDGKTREDLLEEFRQLGFEFEVDTKSSPQDGCRIEFVVGRRPEHPAIGEIADRLEGKGRPWYLKWLDWV